MKRQKVKCEKCGTIFEVSGTNFLMVLTGGLDCPECKTKYGIKIILC